MIEYKYIGVIIAIAVGIYYLYCFPKVKPVDKTFMKNFQDLL